MAVPDESKKPSWTKFRALNPRNARRLAGDSDYAEELTQAMRVSLASKIGGYHGLWARRFIVATWRAAADNHFVGIVLAPLTASSDHRR